MKSVNGLEHLCSPDRVHYLAAKFDERTMYDWELFRPTSSGTTYKRFFNFLVSRYEASKSIVARLKSSQSGGIPSQSINHTKGSTDTECRRCKSFIARESIYTCPGCGRGTAVGERILHCLEHCGAYMKMSVNDRSSCVETAGWCPVHLLDTHNITQCKNLNDPNSICGIDGCQKHHHKSLHGATSAFIANVLATALAESDGKDKVLLSLQSVSTKSGPANCLFDNCSSCCLITKDAAKRFNLLGEKTSFVLHTVNGEKIIESHAYTIILIDNKEEEHCITVYEVENISDSIAHVSLSGVKHLFNEAVQDLWELIDDRPSGEAYILIGENVCGLHPTDWIVNGNLKIKLSKFGSGYVMTGAHSGINSKPMIWNESVAHIRNYSAKRPEFCVNRVSIKPMQEYFAQDALGVAPPRRCGNCLVLNVALEAIDYPKKSNMNIMN